MPSELLSSTRLLAASICLVLLATSASAQEFTVSSTHGDAQVGKNQHSYQAAAPNSIYQVPSWGKTGDNSSLTISFNPKNSFRLLPNSEAQVVNGDGNSSSAWHRVVALKIGSAHIDHDAGAAPSVKLDCETPTAVCGAVGTSYDVDATTGTYSVSSGRIMVSSEQEDRLSATFSGGDMVYNPGSQNTYSHGSITGTVHLDGKAYHASDCSFTIAKKLDGSGETALHISSGSLGDYGPGDYLSDGGGYKRVDSTTKSIQSQYLDAAREEGTLKVKRAAYLAAGRSSPVSAGDVASAAATATELRNKLFTRATTRETVKQTVDAVRNASQQAAGGAAAAASRAGH